MDGSPRGKLTGRVFLQVVHSLQPTLAEIRTEYIDIWKKIMLFIASDV